MPHFSPMNWFIAGIIFYMVLVIFTVNVWWLQSFYFPSNLSFSFYKDSTFWNWS